MQGLPEMRKPQLLNKTAPAATLCGVVTAASIETFKAGIVWARREEHDAAANGGRKAPTFSAVERDKKR